MSYSHSTTSRLWLSLFLSVSALGGVSLTSFSRVEFIQTKAPPNRQSLAKDELQPVDMVARFLDDSHLKLKVKVDKIELRTPYGTLRIPVKDITKIELATRIPEGDRKQIAQAIKDLANANHGKREAAMKVLLKYREKSWPALVEAQKHHDPEVVQRSADLMKRLLGLVPRDILKVRVKDVVHTADSKIAGEIMNPSFRVGTIQFGPQELKLDQLHSLLLPGYKKPVRRNVLADPGSLANYRQQLGQVLYFRITGNNTGTVWGTDTYTTDSTLATAAVHAGAIKLGETGVVKVTMMTPPPNFQGSMRNGVTTAAWGAYPAAYRVEADDED